MILRIAFLLALNIPVADLEAGTKLTVTAILTDGSTMPVEGLDSLFVLPPLPE